MRIFKETIAAVSMLSCSVCLAQAVELFHLNVKDVPVENGKRLEMKFEEIDRSAHFSTVEITLVSGGSVSSSMFVLRGMCGLARARGEQFFRANQVSKAPMRYQVTFLGTATPAELRPANAADKVFSRAECSLLNY